MRKNVFRSQGITALSLALILGLSSCSPKQKYQISNIEGNAITIDSIWDKQPNQEAVDILTPYKAGVDSVMNQVVGYSKETLNKYRPESPLSNLIADVLREAATDVIGHPADLALMNIGGIRNILPAGNITTGTVFEILPFENSLCVLQIKGKFVKELMKNIATVQGEGVSNIELVITKEGDVISAKVGDKEIDDEKIYSLATIDYLADGNDGMIALMQQESRECPAGATLRGLFMEYVKKQTALGKEVYAKIEGRIQVK